MMYMDFSHVILNCMHDTVMAIAQLIPMQLIKPVQFVERIVIKSFQNGGAIGQRVGEHWTLFGT